jgi:hypothetical protein
MVVDTKNSSALIYSATQVDGSPLPKWIDLNALTGKLVAEPPIGQKDIVLRFTVTGAGLQQSLDVKIEFNQ